MPKGKNVGLGILGFLSGMAVALEKINQRNREEQLRLLELGAQSGRFDIGPARTEQQRPTNVLQRLIGRPAFHPTPEGFPVVPVGSSAVTLVPRQPNANVINRARLQAMGVPDAVLDNPQLRAFEGQDAGDVQVVKALVDTLGSLQAEQREQQGAQVVQRATSGFGAPTGQQTAEGRPLLRIGPQAVASERLITVTHPSINNGAPTNIPTIFRGRILGDPNDFDLESEPNFRTVEQQAIRIISQAPRDPATGAPIDPETGRALTPFSTLNEAEAAAQARSQGLGAASQLGDVAQQAFIAQLAPVEQLDTLITRTQTQLQEIETQRDALLTSRFVGTATVQGALKQLNAEADDVRTTLLGYQRERRNLIAEAGRESRFTQQLEQQAERIDIERSREMRQNAEAQARIQHRDRVFQEEMRRFNIAQTQGQTFGIEDIRDPSLLTALHLQDAATQRRPFAERLQRAQETVQEQQLAFEEKKLRLRAEFRGETIVEQADGSKIILNATPSSTATRRADELVDSASQVAESLHITRRLKEHIARYPETFGAGANFAVTVQTALDEGRAGLRQLLTATAARIPSAVTPDASNNAHLARAQGEAVSDAEVHATLARLTDPFTSAVSVGQYLFDVLAVEEAIAANPGGRISDFDLISARRRIGGTVLSAKQTPSKLIELEKRFRRRYADILAKAARPGPDGTTVTIPSITVALQKRRDIDAEVERGAPTQEQADSDLESFGVPRVE